MSRGFDPVFGYRPNWIYNANRRFGESHREPEQADERNCSDPESDKRETASGKIEQVRKNLTKFKCVTEPFKKTLELLEDWEWDT